ncbi:MAG TPA: alpha-(1-_3)-arabinofuranosyltransferase family protein, partial [Jatrophihabitans sp.]|nr:alpha-(1->3)-arabinofuranosyltransferase family protein [Jatrophihabitans sp.]
MPAAEPASAVWDRHASVQRLRLFAVSLGIALAVFAQNAGSVAADTKLDLIVNPGGFLRRALSLWDPIGSAGQLQDQAYGYLFPMGPFFLVGHWLALPPWIIERCWESAVLVAAFLGMVRLAEALAIRGFWPQVGAGLAYALAPRMLSELFSISSELLPVAVLPWLVLPLTDPRSAPRKAAALSGIALLFAGGINASATLAILPAPALYLLTRERGPRRSALIRWWLLSVLLACLWWAIPLLTLGKYSPPFLDWIESAAVTTTPTSLFASLRGVDHWLAYLGPTGWPAGWVLVVAPAAVLATGLVAAAGLAGIVRADGSGRAHRDRRFLVATLLVGSILLTLGHRSGIGPPFALTWQHLLDGPANAFRNVHKFDPLVRLPIALGVGHLLASRPLDRLRLPRPVSWKPAQLVALVAVTVGAVAIGPVFGGRMVPQPRPVADQTWWGQAASWLAANSDGGRALIVPGAGRPNLVWGQTVDDPMQPVATSPWSVRDGLPLTQPGYIRFLDSIDQILARGTGDSTLQVLLARAGVKYLVLRNDLDSAAAGSVPLGFVHATLAQSPGLKLVAGFGPTFGGPQGFSDVTDQGLWPAGSAVQIFSVGDYAGMTGLLPVDQQVSATGSGDALASLAERGLTVAEPVVFGAAAGALPHGTTVATDGIRRREIVFGATNANPATLYADTPFALPRAAHDYLPAGAGPLSTFRLLGVRSVTASSAGDQVGAYLNRGAANGPYSAVDGDPAIAWRSGSAGAAGQWLQVSFEHPISPAGVRIAFAAGLGDYPSRIRVTTDAGQQDSDVANDASSQPLLVPAGSTSRLRITVLQMARGGASVGIAELRIPGVSAARTLDVPLQSAAPDVLAFDVNAGFRAECQPL